MNSIAQLAVDQFICILWADYDGFLAQMDIFIAIIMQNYDPIHHSFDQPMQLILLKRSIAPQSLAKYVF